MLRGDKVTIRPLEEEDLDALYHWYNDEEVNYWANGGWPLSTMLTRDKIAEDILTDPGRYGILAETGKLIGTVGIREINYPARSAVIFIVIGEQEYWNYGYGTDALIVFVKFLFSQWNFHRLSLDTWDGNQRALQAYQKIGFQIEGTQREARYIHGTYHDAILMGLLKKDYLALFPDTASKNSCQKA